MKGILSSILFLFISVLCIAQNNENFEAYVFEENNRGFLNQVKVSIFELPYNALIGEYSSTLPNSCSLVSDKQLTIPIIITQENSELGFIFGDQI